ncbi:Peptidoglycan/LPS O-acetylase OafA/YrhL, contains acyltransferase and SGNH-hydrolase domains [Tardiphaga sp. OK246]|uniref:acyltransferase family protein n=1 Tax=Tardiphaga sp. OK246 TaxID=1855307 RepID=UPI000B734ABB|nr:acyltransferase [Tardiphaga sp. OK246]SNT63917.1 Peptidoglycan/LPS O-acetylase OafA/YrhL, contains acyltransferase and SGNH-hydrolase domains [Tardiphaga sp. OK246]
MGLTYRDNSFDLLRLIAAMLVLWSHQFALVGLPEPTHFNGALGVNIFFAISGYLNTISLTTKASALQFLQRRALRIFPALVGLAVFCVIVALFVSSAPISGILPFVPDFLFRNSTILFGLRYQLPGVFETNPFPSVMNGSLWTLPAEIKLYIYLALISVFVRYRIKLLFLTLIGFYIGFLVWFYVTGETTATAHFNRFAVAFLTGALFAIIEKNIGAAPGFLAVGVLASLTALLVPQVGMLPVICLAAVTLGRIRPPAAINPSLDISYGVYLYAFPIQQIIVTYRFDFWTSLSLSVLGTVVMAILSAVLIEQPALRLGRSRLAIPGSTVGVAAGG